MGVWATGLYAGDFALDLRSTIAAVAKLPFDSDRLLEILCESEPEAANSEEDNDHTTFWLVVADQFSKRGIINKRASDMALAIIESDRDLAMLEKLGMQAADLRKRKKVLGEVQARITAPAGRIGQRKVMKKPQPMLMESGDVLVYPTFGGRCRNPYFVDQDEDCMGTVTPWRVDGWAAMVIVDSGRAFDFLPWYRPLTVARAMQEKPTLATLEGDLTWKLSKPGTSTASHFKRMGIEKIGTVALDREKVNAHFGELRQGISAAVADISIANQISVGPYSVNLGRPYPTIEGLEQIIES